MTTLPNLDPAVFSHHTAQANGVRLHYVRGGQGPVLLLWHGFLETWYCWRKIMPRLAESYTVVAPDMRGYADSDKPATGYDARTLAEDFRALVQQLGLPGPVILVAHDMGANVRHLLEGVARHVRGGAVPDCGHFIADEQPGYLLQQLEALLADPKAVLSQRRQV